MIIVSNTTPLHYIIQIGETRVLKDLFGRIIIPEAVHAEMQHEKTPPAVKDWIAAHPSWLKVRRSDASFVSPRKKLGDGERATIALAIELSANALLMDDRDGIKEARDHDLLVVTTLGVLEKASQKGLIDFRRAVERLSKTNFRMPPLEVIEDMLREAASEDQAD